MADYTVDSALAAVRRLARVPDGDSGLSDTEMLAIGDETMSELMVPLVRELREDYWVTTTTITLSADVEEYRVPERAIGSTLRHALLQRTSGSDKRVGALAQYTLELGSLRKESTAYGTYGGAGFFFQGGQITVVDVGNLDGYQLVLYYENRPGQLVQTSAAAQVTAVTGAVYTCASVPLSWTNTTKLDALQGVTPYETLTMSVTPSTVTVGGGGNVTLATSVSDLVVGGWFAQVNESPVLQFPWEARSVFLRAWQERVLDALGDDVAAASAARKVDRGLEALRRTMEPRNTGYKPRIVPRASPLRSRRRW